MNSEYMPSRLYVVRELQRLIEGARWGDETLAGRVSVGKIIMGDELGAGPWVNIIESPQPDFAAFAGRDEVRADEWVLLLQGFVERTPEGEADPAYWLQAEVEIQLSKVFMDDPRTGNPAYPEIRKRFRHVLVSLRPNPPVIRAIENTMDRIAFYQPLTIGVASRINMPFVKIEQ